MLYRIVFSVVLLMLFTANLAGAQTEVASMTFGTQLAVELELGTDTERASSLHRIVEISAFHPEYDLTPTVPSLSSIYRSHPNPAYRVMAAAALHQIGDERGLQVIREHLTAQRDRRVQIASIEALRQYYGAETFRGDRTVAAMVRELLAER